MISIIGPGNWPSGASLERNVHPLLGLARTLIHISLMKLLVTPLIHHHYWVKARNLSLWINNFLMRPQGLQHVPSLRAQEGRHKVSLALSFFLTTFQLRTMEPLSRRREYKSGR